MNLQSTIQTASRPVTNGSRRLNRSELEGLSEITFNMGYASNRIYREITPDVEPSNDTLNLADYGVQTVSASELRRIVTGTLPAEFEPNGNREDTVQELALYKVLNDSATQVSRDADKVARKAKMTAK